MIALQFLLTTWIVITGIQVGESMSHAKNHLTNTHKPIYSYIHFNTKAFMLFDS